MHALSLALAAVRLHVPPMRFSVHFAPELDPLPAGPRVAIAQAMETIAISIGDISNSSPFWTSMRESVLQIVVAGWRVGYRIDSDARRLEVVSAVRAEGRQQRG